MSATDPELQAVAELAEARRRIHGELARRIVGQQDVIDNLLVALFARGHSLFVGVPGLAKTLLISSLADVLDLKFQRIQFTPDLMPSDITGTDILEQDQTTGARFFRFIKGPIFANLILADEINRTPAKTQAALLQAMQEYQVTASGKTHELPMPFWVFATQNPIEQEGTYALPEAQLDRFMFQINVGYPTFTEEIAIVKGASRSESVPLDVVIGPDLLNRLQALVRRVPVADHIVRFAVMICRYSRPSDVDAPALIKEYFSWGAGPRASQHLILAAQARAVLDGRYTVHRDDISALALPILAHRLVRNFQGEAEGIEAEDVVSLLIQTAVRTFDRSTR